MIDVLGVLSLGGRYSAFKMRAWPSLILNRVPASTFAVVSNRDFEHAYKAKRTQQAGEAGQRAG